MQIRPRLLHAIDRRLLLDPGRQLGQAVFETDTRLKIQQLPGLANIRYAMADIARAEAAHDVGLNIELQRAA